MLVSHIDSFRALFTTCFQSQSIWRPQMSVNKEPIHQKMHTPQPLILTQLSRQRHVNMPNNGLWQVTVHCHKRFAPMHLLIEFCCPQWSLLIEDTLYPCRPLHIILYRLHPCSIVEEKDGVLRQNKARNKMSHDTKQ